MATLVNGVLEDRAWLAGWSLCVVNVVQCKMQGEKVLCYRALVAWWSAALAGDVFAPLAGEYCGRARSPVQSRAPLYFFGLFHCLPPCLLHSFFFLVATNTNNRCTCIRHFASMDKSFTLGQVLSAGAIGLLTGFLISQSSLVSGSTTSPSLLVPVKTSDPKEKKKKAWCLMIFIFYSFC